MAAFSRTADGYRLQNDAGDFVVYTDVVQENGRVAGPGYVAQWTAPDGNVLVDGLEAGFVSANDPEIGGIGIPAWHHFHALAAIRDPRRHTIQLRPEPRARAHFLPGDVNVVACAAEAHRCGPNGRVSRYGVRRPWMGSGGGLDGWAHAANTREVFDG